MGKIRRYVLAVLALAAGIPGVQAAETLAYWTFGEHGLADISGHNVALTATNVEFGETGYATLNGTNAWLETTGRWARSACGSTSTASGPTRTGRASTGRRRSVPAR